MCSALLILVITIFSVIDYSHAEEKSVMATRTALSSVKAEYNRYIFDKYHILTFDLDCEGLGEGGIEEKIKNNITENLGNKYKVNDVRIVDYTCISDDECKAFKEQIRDCVKYMAGEYCAEKILNDNGGEDGVLSKDIEADMDAVDEGCIDDSNDEDAVGENEKKAKDPRKFTSKLKKKGVLGIVMPSYMDVSDVLIDTSDLPSKDKDLGKDKDDVDSNFKRFRTLKKDLKDNGKWKDAFLDISETGFYACNVFNNALDRNVNEDTVLELEIEYLVCGKNNDKKNLKSVVNRIIGIRFPLNYSYLIKDSVRMEKINVIATSLAAVSVLPMSVVKYLLAGCWSYVEAVSDVRHLLHGKKVALRKSNDTWKTDIENFEETIRCDGPDDASGLAYKDYLCILLGLEKKKIYYRMLDVIQLNACQNREKYRIKRAAVNIAVEVEIEYRNKIINIKEVGIY